MRPSARPERIKRYGASRCTSCHDQALCSLDACSHLTLYLLGLNLCRQDERKAQTKPRAESQAKSRRNIVLVNDDLSEEAKADQLTESSLTAEKIRRLDSIGFAWFMSLYFSFSGVGAEGGVGMMNVCTRF
eukprot:scaffold3999_cov138-Skeletonema_dohrnii-CCMP3373.AAC.26